MQMFQYLSRFLSWMHHSLCVMCLSMLISSLSPFLAWFQWWFMQVLVSLQHAAESASGYFPRPPPEPDSVWLRRLYVVVCLTRPTFISHHVVPLFFALKHFSLRHPLPTISSLLLVSTRHVVADSSLIPSPSVSPLSSSPLHHCDIFCLFIFGHTILHGALLLFLLPFRKSSRSSTSFGRAWCCLFTWIDLLHWQLVQVHRHAAELRMAVLSCLPPWPDLRLLFLPLLGWFLLHLCGLFHSVGATSLHHSLVIWLAVMLALWAYWLWSSLLFEWVGPWLARLLLRPSSRLSEVPTVIPFLYHHRWWMPPRLPRSPFSPPIVCGYHPSSLLSFLPSIRQVARLGVIVVMLWVVRFWLSHPSDPVPSRSRHFRTYTVRWGKRVSARKRWRLVNPSNSPLIPCPSHLPSSPITSRFDTSSLPFNGNIPSCLQSPVWLDPPWLVDDDLRLLVSTSGIPSEFGSWPPSSFDAVSVGSVTWTYTLYTSCWRESRTFCRRVHSLGRRMYNAFLHHSLPPPPPPPSPEALFMVRVSRFLEFFDPSTAARDLMAPWTCLNENVYQTSVPLDLYSSTSWQPSDPLLSIASTITSLDLHCLVGSSICCSPLIIDTGASVCISPHREDFVTYHGSSMQIKALSNTNMVAGEGMLQWKVRGTNGDVITLELPGYHIPAASVRLLSPQVVLQPSVVMLFRQFPVST